MATKIENPWDVGSVYDYLFFNCPTCCYKSSLKQYFVDHVFHTHPESIDYLGRFLMILSMTLFLHGAMMNQEKKI